MEHEIRLEIISIYGMFYRFSCYWKNDLRVYELINTDSTAERYIYLNVIKVYVMQFGNSHNEKCVVEQVHRDVMKYKLPPIRCQAII